MNELTLIIPAKNEAESLPKVLDELEKYSYKINVVLHGNDEKTINSIKKYNIEIIYQKNLGYGDALIYGIKNCKTKYFCIFNADGSFNPSEINIVLNKLLKEDLDFVFASRYENNSGSEDDTITTLIGNYIFTSLGTSIYI